MVWVAEEHKVLIKAQCNWPVCPAEEALEKDHKEKNGRTRDDRYVIL